MGQVKRTAGALLMGLGFLIALFPFISVWRVSGQVLSELPEVSDTGTSDTRHRMAIFDGDFVLATRTYDSASVDDVKSALAGSGFQSARIAQKPWLTKDCCGEWDAVMVDVTEGASGSTVAVVTVYDTDVQAAFVFFPLLGMIPALIGLVLWFSSNRRRPSAVRRQLDVRSAA